MTEATTILTRADTPVASFSNPQQLDATIGVGFDLRSGGRAVQNAVFAEMGFAQSMLSLTTPPTTGGAPALDEYNYVQRLRNDIATGTATSISDLDTVMAQRNAQYNSDLAFRTFVDASVAPGSGIQRSSFAFLSDAELSTVFQTLWSTIYQPLIFQKFPALQTDAGFRSSRELQVLASMIWNGGSGLLGSGLVNAIDSGNRAQAWYEIRYNSDRSGSPVSAMRQYFLSQVFSLYDTPGTATLTEAFQAYEMFAQHRDTIVPYEIQFGTDPYGANPLVASQQEVTNGYVPANPPVDSLAASLLPPEVQIANAIAYVPGFSSAAQIESFVSPANVLVASSAVPTIDASIGYGASAAEQENANHLLLGAVSGDTLIGGMGNDILIAGGGSELLVAGSGSDTIVAGQALPSSITGAAGLIGGAAGNDTVNTGPGFDTIDFALPSSGSLTETIVPWGTAGNLNGITAFGTQTGGVVEVSSGGGQPTVLGGSATQQIPGAGGLGTGVLTWSAADGTQYQYTQSTGVLAITGGSLGTNAIDIQNFNLAAAESATGYLGIFLKSQGQTTAGATIGTDPPAQFAAGSEQSYTFSTDAAASTARTITYTLSGASASDFEVVANGQPAAPISANGTFTVTLAAGETAVSFGLVDVTGGSTIASGTTFSLTASMPDLANPGGTPITTAPLDITYMPGVATTGTATAVITGTYSATTGITTYSGDGGNDVIDTTGSQTAANQVNLTNGFNTVTGGAGQQDTISGYGTTGSSVIVGNGGTDVIVAGGGNNQIYANTQQTLAQAIAGVGSGPATNLQWSSTKRRAASISRRPSTSASPSTGSRAMRRFCSSRTRSPRICRWTNWCGSAGPMCNPAQRARRDWR